MSNRTWFYSIVGLLLVAFLGIGGVCYYGVVVLPQQNRANDLKACDSFANGIIRARNAAIQMLDAKPRAKDSDIAQKYATIADAGIDEAFNQATANGDIYNALAQLGMARLNFDPSQGVVAIQNKEAAYTGLEQLCSAIQPTASATPTPSTSATASPSATIPAPLGTSTNK